MAKSVLRFALVFACVTVHAQFGERIDVHVVDLEIVALDRSGNAVTDLRKEELSVLVNGSPAEIVDFAPHFAVDPAVRVPENNSRVWLVFIDMFRAGEFRRMVAVRELRDFLKTAMQPGDRIMVAMFDGAALRVLQPVTDEHHAAMRAIESLTFRAMPSRLETLGMQMDEEEHEQLERAAMRALRDYVSISGGADGRRLLLLVGGGYKLHDWTTADRTARVLREYEALRDTLASSDVVMYGVWAWKEGLFGSDLSIEAEPTIDGSAIAVTPGGFGTTIATLAHDTGGSPFVAASDLKERLQRAERASQGYYALAFRSPANTAGKRLNVRVKVAREGVRVRHRRLARIATDVETVKKTNVGALLAERTENPWRVAVKFGPTRRDMLRRFRAPLSIRVPIRDVLFVEQNGRHAGHLQFFVSVRDAKGNYTSLDPKDLKLVFSRAELDAFRKRGIDYELELIVSSGTTDVSLTVADAIGRTHSTVRFEIRP